MRISIVCVGKIKEKFYVQAVCEYVKRLSRYCKLDIIELPDEKTPENAGEQLNLAIKAKEGDRILSSLKDDAYVIALAIEGKMLDSVEFSQKIEKLGIDSVSHIMFVIGGLLRGYERENKKKEEKKNPSQYDYMKPYMVSCVISVFTCISCQSARTENA